MGLQTVRAMLNGGWPALLAALSSPLTTNVSDPQFGDVLGVLQALVRVAGCLALPTPRDASLTALPKAAFSPRVVAAPEGPPQAQQASRSPSSLERLTLGLAGSGRGSGGRSAARLSAGNLMCLREFVAAAKSLAITLGTSWFVVLEAFQDVNYVLTTRGAAPPSIAVLGPNTSATSGTPGQRCGAQAEGLAIGSQRRL